MSILNKLFRPHFLKGKKIILDCAHAALYKLAPFIFKQFGADVVTINNRPNGYNINKKCGSLYPSRLQQAVIKHNADIGFAFDGDGDRVILVNRKATIKNGDDILAILSTHPLYINEKTIVGTVMSNQGLEQFLKKNKKDLVRTSVGDRCVSDYLTNCGGLLGGEQSGHIIMRDYMQMGDGIVTALRILEAIEKTKNWDLKTFDIYPQVLINIPVRIKKNLEEPIIAQLIADYKSQLDSGRLIIRYSGTEKLLRIMVEDRTQEQANKISAHLAHALQKELQ